MSVLSESIYCELRLSNDEYVLARSKARATFAESGR